MPCNLVYEERVCGNCGIWLCKKEEDFKNRFRRGTKGAFFSHEEQGAIFGALLGMQMFLGDVDITPLPNCVVEKIQTRNGPITVEYSTTYEKKVYNGDKAV